MKLSAGKRKLYGFLFVSAAGTFLHFLYEISGENVVAGLFSAVNESIWEHMKLIFYPMVLASGAEQRLGAGETGRIRFVTLAGILLALAVIPAAYYTYTGILGVSADWFNITIFFLAAGGAYALGYRLEAGNGTWSISSCQWWGAVLLMAAVFTAATFFPPRIPLFRDPLTGTYGIREIP